MPIAPCDRVGQTDTEPKPASVPANPVKGLAAGHLLPQVSRSQKEDQAGPEAGSTGAGASVQKRTAVRPLSRSAYRRAKVRRIRRGPTVISTLTLSFLPLTPTYA